MTDVDDALAVLAPLWIAWDTAAEAMGERERRSEGRDRPNGRTLERQAHAKEQAIADLGLDSTRLHEAVARHRTRTAADGEPLSIPDALQAALQELLPAPPIDLQEAS